MPELAINNFCIGGVGSSLSLLAPLPSTLALLSLSSEDDDELDRSSKGGLLSSYTEQRAA